MNIQQIRYFLALADELHFWKTSEKVFITQSALSRQIKALEDELGVELFERNKRSVKLTDAGRFMKTELAKIVTDLDDAAARALQIAAGEIATIRIGHPASITFSVLPKILGSLAETHPQLAVQMFEVDSVDVDAFLLSHRIDVAFNREITKSNELESRLLMTENFAVVLPSNRDFSSLSELRDEWFVLPSLAGKSEHAAQLRAIFDDAGFEPKVRFESDFGATLLGLVAKGLGVSVMPISYSFYLSEEVKFVEIPFPSSLYATRRINEKSAAMTNFMNVVETALMVN